MSETLAERLNRIIDEQNITKREFARRIGVGETYVYVITGGGRKNNLNQKISPALARVISTEFGYDLQWILTGQTDEAPKEEELRQKLIAKIEQLPDTELLALKNFIEQRSSAT